MCVCVCGDILMLPDGVLHQFHIKAEPSGKTASYKLLKQHNKTLKRRAVCACLRVCVLFMFVKAVCVTDKYFLFFLFYMKSQFLWPWTVLLVIDKTCCTADPILLLLDTQYSTETMLTPNVLVRKQQNIANKVEHLEIPARSWSNMSDPMPLRLEI